VIVTLPTDGTLWIDDLIELVEAQASSELFALLKREDERLVTQRAYDNPKFVEDLVRDVAAQLERDSRVGAYRVSCENFESIHNHSAFALIERDGRPGLNGQG
jgi:GTP cyclohydrolase I